MVLFLIFTLLVLILPLNLILENFGNTGKQKRTISIALFSLVSIVWVIFIYLSFMSCPPEGCTEKNSVINNTNGSVLIIMGVFPLLIFVITIPWYYFIKYKMRKT